MTKVRMFDDGSPEGEIVPSPRTTIVGGRPPEPGAELPPVPTGIQQLLRLASVDPAFCHQLLEQRAAVAEAAGVELTASERAILAAVPAPQLAGMVDRLPPPAPDRRGFLRETASAAVLLLGGAGIVTQGACPNSMLTAGGAAPDPPPPRPQHNEMESEGGASPRRPPHRPEAPGGAAPDVPPPKPDAGTKKRKTADDESERERHRLSQSGGGAAPDVPKPRPDGGAKKKKPSPTRGHRADVPPGPLDDPEE